MSYIRTKKGNRLTAALLRDLARFAEGPISTTPEKGVALLLRILRGDPDAVPVGDAEPELRAWSAGEVATFQRELRRFLRQMVAQIDAGGAGLMPTVRVHRLEFAPRFTRADVLLTIDGAARDVIWFQIIGLMRSAGVDRFQLCDCGRVFAKTGRREFCSLQCQKRVYMRNKRAEERKLREKGKGHGKKTRTR